MMSGVSRPRLKVAFTDFWHGNSPAEITANPLFKVLSRHHDLELSDDPDFLVYSCFGHKYLKYDCTRIFFTGENIRPDFSECDYAFSFDYPTDQRNYRLPLYYLYPDLERLRGRRSAYVDVSTKKFCNFVYSNRKARERITFLEKLQQYKPVDCGGKVNNNIGGRVADKRAFLKHYKFTIAFENASHPGYTTEKIMEALVTGTIPIYWGNPLVGRDFNPACYINCHDFDSYDDVIRHIIEVDNNDDLYQAYITAPAFVNEVDNEFINEANLATRIEAIFSGPTRSAVAGRFDRLKHALHPMRPVDFLRSSARRWRQYRQSNNR